MPQPNWMAPYLSIWGIPGGGQEPLSGDVSQWFRIFSPTVTVNGRGDPALEGAIVRDVATYGAQLGPLTEIVLALADRAGLKSPAVVKLLDIQRRIEQKKTEYEAGAVERARKALADLGEINPSALPALLKEFGPSRG